MTRTRGTATTAIAISAAAAVIAGLIVSGGPIRARMENRDESRIRDLRQINENVDCQANTLGRLPDTPRPTEACPGVFPLTDPYTDQPYRYERVDDRHWRVCASFELPDISDADRFGPQFDAERGCLVSETSLPRTEGITPMDQFQIQPPD